MAAMTPSTSKAGMPIDSSSKAGLTRSRASRFTITDKSGTDKQMPSFDGPTKYEWEWESAKSKPHARIISRKFPRLAAAQTGEIENMFGLSRYGKLNAPKAVITGRTVDPTLPKPDDRPAAYSALPKAGKYKPNPLILSRHKPIEVGSGSGVMQNIYGLTRFGKANPPRPVIIGRQVLKDKKAPGPGAYDSHIPVDTKVGIQIKGRLKAWEHESPQPGANAYDLPSFMGDAPAFSFARRYVDDIYSRSPGPIYNIRQPLNRKKGKSLTFKPFPMKQQKEFPGPNEYSNLPGKQKIETTQTRAPIVRFAGKPFNKDEEFVTNLIQVGPGPADFNLSKYHGTSRDRPHAIIMSRPKVPYDACGSGKMENLYGKTRFGARKPPRCLILSRHPKKEKFEPGPGAYDPQIRKDTMVGIKMKSRWTNSKQDEISPGPGDYNIPGSMGQGPAFSMVPKFRGVLGISEKAPKLIDDSDCKKAIEENAKPKEICCLNSCEPAPVVPFQCPQSWQFNGLADIDTFLPMLDKLCHL